MQLYSIKNNIQVKNQRPAFGANVSVNQNAVKVCAESIAKSSNRAQEDIILHVSRGAEKIKNLSDKLFFYIDTYKNPTQDHLTLIAELPVGEVPSIPEPKNFVEKIVRKFFPPSVQEQEKIVKSALICPHNIYDESLYNEALNIQDSFKII